MRILIVDDNRDLADVLAIMLVDVLGPHTVATVAYDGDEGLRSALADPPHAILMDLDMPVMSGADAAFLIRTVSASSPPRLLAMTGRMRPAEETTAFDQVLLKPVELDELVRSLEGLER